MSTLNGAGTLAYIHDGYTLKGYIAATPRLHPALRFDYRPMLTQNRSVIYRQIEQTQDARKEESIAAATVRSQLVSWDMVDHEGTSVPLEVPHILRSQPMLFQRLFRIVTGSSPSDEDPESHADEQAEDAEQSLHDALAGTTPEEHEAAAVKN
ncbi:hypothetical protein [uncultured Mediterranean phage uvDeep-CGR2-KM19-C37]|nr:hypothetical protein [uncultured Mediterranean phage uvDeep-CGR2-KM19-C37]